MVIIIIIGTPKSRARDHRDKVLVEPGGGRGRAVNNGRTHFAFIKVVRQGLLRVAGERF